MPRLLIGLLSTTALACAHPGGSAVQTPQFLNPPGLAAGRGYSQVVYVPAAQTLYISGQVPLDAEGKLVGAGDFRAQAEQVFRNLQTALEGVGGSLSDVVKINIYVRDMSQLGTLREVREQFLGSGPRPASTLVEVKSLFREDVLLEIEAIATPRPPPERPAPSSR
jgi:reactive intermediate/imine deaminase